MPQKHRVSVSLTENQYALARRRLFTDGQSWQHVLNALVNAYIVGDVSVTEAGRYHLAPPSSHAPLIQVPSDDELVEVDVDWGINAERPQVGHGNTRQKPRAKPRWGTKELGSYLREATGRRIRLQSLRELLRYMEVPKANGSRWSFAGEHDPLVVDIRRAIEDGTYDSLVREGTERAAMKRKAKRERETELTEAQALTEEQRRLAHLRRLRQTQLTESD